MSDGVTASEGGDRRENRMTLVPAFGVYEINQDTRRVRGSTTGVRVDATTCTPMPDDGEGDLGLWMASKASLRAMCGGGDRGPLSGVDQPYEDRGLVMAAQRILLTPDRLLGAAEGRTGWGDSGDGKVGRIVVWDWKFEHIDEISTSRLKRFTKMWDVGLTIRCNEPKAVFDFSGLGGETEVFMARDAKAKAARIEKSDALGFATLLSSVAAASTHRVVSHTAAGDPKEPVDTFRLS